MKFVVAAVLAAAALSSGSIVKTGDDTFELLILHNNDMHARFEQTSQSSGACTTADREAGKCYGGFPRVAHVVKEARQAAKTGEGPPVLYLNAGDTYTGTAWFTLYKWKIAAEFINALQPDAVSLGNHEFDDGVSGLTPFVRNLTCPVLAANLILTKEPDLQKEHNLIKSVVFNISKTKIGVIGYLTPETKILSLRNDVEYIDEVVAIKAEAARLKNEGVNILIALGHSGYDTDQRIAKEVEDIDVVIGGHSNTFLWNGVSPDSEKVVDMYPRIVQQTSGRSVPVVQAYAYTKYLGQLNLVFDTKGEIITIRDGNPILLNYSIPQDPEVLDIVNRYRGDVEKITSQVVGNTSIVLDGSSCRLRECNIGNMITDAMIHRYASEYKGYGWTDAPIAIIQGGGIRTSIDHINLPANITIGDLLLVMPFGSHMVKLTLKGVDIKSMLEHSVAQYDTISPRGQFLQMSGLKVEYDFGRKPDERVISVYVRCGECLNPTYSALNYTGVYNILMPAFLSLGGDGFSVFVGRPAIPLSYDEFESSIGFIKSHSPMYPAIEGRINIINYENFKSLGNHEFDEGVAGVVPFIRNLSAPVLAANLRLDKVPEMKDMENLYKSIIITKDRVKMGIIGYLTPETKFLVPKNNVEYEDEIVAIRREVKKMKEQGVNILIALGHSGFVKDLEIAREVDDLDLVIGGHSNTFLWNDNSTTEKPEVPQGHYPTDVKQANGRTVRVVQAYAFTKYLGKLHIKFDSEGEIIECNGNPILLDFEIPRDPQLLQTVNKYREDVNRIYNEVVGSSDIFLNGDCRLRECNLGDFIADAMLNYTHEVYHDKYPGANLALIQGGRIRTSIDHPERPMKLTRGDWIIVLPYSDQLTIVTMNGTTLKQSLEHSVSTWRAVDSTGQFQQISGMKVTYDLARPVGSRVVEVKAACSSCSITDLREVKDYEEYKMIMPSFIAEGGDGYTLFTGLPMVNLNYNELDCVLYYLSKHSPVNPQVDGRIRVLNEDKVSNTIIATRLISSANVKYSNLYNIIVAIVLCVYL